MPKLRRSRTPKKLRAMSTSIRPESVPESESNTQITPPPEEPGGAMTFFEHLSELRKRIVNSLISIGIGAAIGWFAAPHFVKWIVKPMTDALTKAHLYPELVGSQPPRFLNLRFLLPLDVRHVTLYPSLLSPSHPAG